MTATFRILFVSILCISCAADKGPLTEVFEFPDSLSEVSAVEMTDSKNIWVLQDSGNEPELYSLDLNGNITQTLAVDATNTDWEALAADADGNLYIGDFGNNKNERKDLIIYKIDAETLDNKKTAPSQKTAFYYPDQTEFPPKKIDRFYDAEAFFIYNDNFYVFSKNRSSKFDGTTTCYKIPNKDGRYAAQKMGSFAACNAYKQCAITAADISPDGKTVALLTAKKVYLLNNFKGDDFFSGKSREIDLGSFSQKESLCFVSNTEIYIADERDKKTGGKLYRLEMIDF